MNICVVRVSGACHCKRDGAGLVAGLYWIVFDVRVRPGLIHRGMAGEAELHDESIHIAEK